MPVFSFVSIYYMPGMVYQWSRTSLSCMQSGFVTGIRFCVLAELENSTGGCRGGPEVTVSRHSGQLERSRGEEGQTGIVSAFHLHPPWQCGWPFRRGWHTFWLGTQASWRVSPTYSTQEECQQISDRMVGCSGAWHSTWAFRASWGCFPSAFHFSSVLPCDPPSSWIMRGREVWGT